MLPAEAAAGFGVPAAASPLSRGGLAALRGRRQARSRRGLGFGVRPARRGSRAHAARAPALGAMTAIVAVRTGRAPRAARAPGGRGGGGEEEEKEQQHGCSPRSAARHLGVFHIVPSEPRGRWSKRAEGPLRRVDMRGPRRPGTSLSLFESSSRACRFHGAVLDGDSALGRRGCGGTHPVLFAPGQSGRGHSQSGRDQGMEHREGQSSAP